LQVSGALTSISPLFAEVLTAATAEEIPTEKKVNGFCSHTATGSFPKGSLTLYTALASICHVRMNTFSGKGITTA